MKAIAATVFITAVSVALAQPAPEKTTFKAKRTADGQPDLQGIWTNATVTPLERPAELASKAFLTEKEAAEYEQVVRERNNMDKRSADKQTDLSRAYNDVWYDRGTKAIRTRRTSLVVDPADGKIPAFTPEAQQRVAAAAQQAKEKCAQSACDAEPENYNLTTRCIHWPTAGPPMLPSAYNNNYQIFQTPGYVAILIEMIHDIRIIPLDNRPRLPGNVRPYMGDSRGHWEGETLVVETTNFSGRNNFRNTTENMRLTERFTRVDAETLRYQFTVDDPKTFTRPWTAEIPMMATAGPLYEYACHEANYAMKGILSGARGK